MLKSLAEAHSYGLVHRDVKPGNIVFHRMDKEEAVKLIDFGMVRLAGSNLTQRGQILGTPAYMSPEQARGRDLDVRSDLYSLGCVLYECVACRPPFVSSNGPLDVMRAHLRDTPQPQPLDRLTPSVEPRLAAIIHMALAKEANDRFQSPTAMLQAIRSIQLSGDSWRSDVRRSGPEMTRRTRHPSTLTPSALSRPAHALHPGRGRRHSNQTRWRGDLPSVVRQAEHGRGSPGVTPEAPVVRARSAPADVDIHGVTIPLGPELLELIQREQAAAESRAQIAAEDTELFDVDAVKSAVKKAKRRRVSKA